MQIVGFAIEKLLLFFHSVRRYKGALNSYVYDHYGYMILVSVSELLCVFIP